MIYFVGPERNIPSEVYKQATMQDVVDYCKDKEYLGVDTETEGMNFLRKKMIMLQIGDDDNQFVIDTRHVSVEPLRDILESNSSILSGTTIPGHHPALSGAQFPP